MELREILNRVEGIIINAKSRAAALNMPEVQTQLLKLKAFLNREHVKEKLAELPEPAEQPATESDIKNLQQETTGLGKDIENLASYPESRQEPESKAGAGVVSESEKSQIKDGSGIA